MWCRIVFFLNSTARSRHSASALPRIGSATTSLRSALVSSTALLLLTAAYTASARGAAPDSGVVEALQKKYTVTHTTPDGEQITKDGATMVLKCAGVYSLPTSVLIEPDNTVTDGSIKTPSMFTRMTWTKMGSHVLQTGDKVYITKIESKNGSNDELRFTVITVNSLDVTGGDAQKKYKAIVSFKFKKGYLEESPPEEVEQAIEAVMAPDTGGDDAQGGDNNAGAANQPQGPPVAQRAAAPPPPQRIVTPPPAAPAGPPPTISMGESSTEVLQAMGMPQQMIDLGKKKTYIYKNMKVVFLNDKVTDVQ